MEFIKACQDLKWSQDTNALHRSETSRIVERAVRRARAGTATAMVQSGRPDEWWDCATECCCYLRKVHDKMADGTTAYENSGVQFDGLLISFGATVSHKTISSKDEARLHQLAKRCYQFGRRMLPGIFMGSVSRVRGGWRGDLLIADCEYLEKLVASDMHVKRSKHQEAVQEGKLFFPCADGSLRLLYLPHLPRGQMPARGHPEQNEKEEEANLSKKKTV